MKSVRAVSMRIAVKVIRYTEDESSTPNPRCPPMQQVAVAIVIAPVKTVIETTIAALRPERKEGCTPDTCVAVSIYVPLRKTCRTLEHALVIVV